VNGTGSMLATGAVGIEISLGQGTKAPKQEDELKAVERPWALQP